MMGTRFTVLIIGLLLVLFVRPCLPGQNMRPIAGFPLWIGHVGDVRDPRLLFSNGIRAVIDLALNESPAAIPRELVYCRFPLIDGGGNPPWLLHAAIDCVANLLRCGTPTLIYCGAGMSRSPCIAAAAIARVRGCPAHEALIEVAKSGTVDVAPALWADVKATPRPRHDSPLLEGWPEVR